MTRRVSLGAQVSGVRCGRTYPLACDPCVCVCGVTLREGVSACRGHGVPDKGLMHRWGRLDVWRDDYRVFSQVQEK